MISQVLFNQISIINQKYNSINLFHSINDYKLEESHFKERDIIICVNLFHYLY